MIMAGYRLKEGEARAFWPALLALASRLLIFVLRTPSASTSSASRHPVMHWASGWRCHRWSA
jgi:hypothetical protein